MIVEYDRPFQIKSAWVLFGCLGCVLLNGGLSLLNAILELPFFLDSNGTAIAGALFGPLPGMLTGVLTNLFHEVLYGFSGTHYPFGIVNGATGLIVGLMAKRQRLWTFQDVALTIVVVSLLNALLGSTIAALLYGGVSDASVDTIVTSLILAGRSILSAAFIARIPVNLVDKALAVALAWAAVRIVRRRVLGSPDTLRQLD